MSDRDSGSGVGTASTSLSGAGVGYALLAYVTWGVTPIYWKQLSSVGATGVLAYRVLGSLLLMLVLLAGLGQLRGATTLVRAGRARWLLLASALLLGTNWWVFIYAVETNRIIDTSLGYYLTPLLNVALGMALFGERLTRAQGIAVALAALGVAQMAVAHGRLPWISLALGGSFAIYGALRKSSGAGSMHGLLFESAVLTLPALVYLLFGEKSGEVGLSALGQLPLGTQLLLAGGGAITAFPLLCFASAASRLPLSAVGIFQYIAPSISLVIALALYDEPFTPSQALTFGLIWIALGLYTWEGLLRRPVPLPAEAETLGLRGRKPQPRP